MKIDTIRSTTTSNIKTAGKKNKPNGAFQELLDIGTEQMSNIEQLSAIAPSFMYYDDDSAQDNQAKEHASKMIDVMTDIRDSIIDKKVVKQDFVALEELVQQAKKFFITPELSEVIKEVETRAAVEIAKLNKFEESIN